MFDFEVEPDALIGSDFSGSVEDSKTVLDIYAARLNSFFKSCL
jgi:hypothetical protein